MRPPSREEIRRKALELWYKYYAPKTGAYTTPSEQELKELGLWHEAQVELMRSEASRLEQMIERATAEELEQIYSAIEEMMSRLDELEEEIRRLREQREEQERRRLEHYVETLDRLEQQVTMLESENKVTPEEAQRLYMMIRRARELDGREPEKYNILVHEIEALIKQYRAREHRPAPPTPRVTVYPLTPPRPTTPLTVQPSERRVYLRLKNGRVCLDEETELDIEEHGPHAMIDYVRTCGYIYGTPEYFPLDKYIELTPRMFRPITLWRWIADIIRYVRAHEQELRRQLTTGHTIYFRFPDTSPVVEAGWTA